MTQYDNTPENKQPAEPVSKPMKRSRVVGLVAAFCAVTILISAVTGISVYTAMKGGLNLQAPQTSSLQPDAGQAGSTDQSQSASSLPNSNKSFSLEAAAAKQDPNRVALSISDIAAKGKPAIVAINTEIAYSTPFGQNGTMPAAGSGFILTQDGYIVTNQHVIDSAQKITVVLDDGTEYPATLVGSDSINDLAVLKIDAKNLPTVVLGTSADLEVGELAVAIGNPLGELSGTVTAGIISALDREINIEGQTMRVLQTDAAINAGNSGGALFNSFGEVIGINNAKNAGTGIEGLGFAIPIDHAKPIIESLIKTGSTIEPFRLGIYTQDIPADQAQQYNLPEGVYIIQVEKGSAAEKAGLIRGDVIVAANGKAVKTTEALQAIKNSLNPGDKLAISIVRGSDKLDLAIVVTGGQA